MKRLIYLLVTLFAAVSVVSAQNTTTEIAGRVIDEMAKLLQELPYRLSIHLMAAIMEHHQTVRVYILFQDYVPEIIKSLSAL